MSYNQGYQDGLSGLKRPSNGDQSSFADGWAARQQKEFHDMLQRQQRQAQESAAQRNKKSGWW